MTTRTNNLIGHYIEQAEWKKARRLLKTYLKKEPQNYAILSTLGLTYYEERHYEKALLWAEKALYFGKDDPLVLWDYAGTLEMLGQTDRAIAIWEQIVAWGAKKVGTELCQEGLRWGKSLVNDCRYRLALAHRDQGNFPKATDYLREHLAHRKGTPSLYTLKEVRKEWKKLN